MTRDDCDVELERQQTMAEHARNHLEPAYVLMYLQDELATIHDEADHPLWGLVQQCVSEGTYSESGKLPYRCATVGAQLLPLIDRAIQRLVQEMLDSGSAWED